MNCRSLASRVLLVSSFLGSAVLAAGDAGTAAGPFELVRTDGAEGILVPAGQAEAFLYGLTGTKAAGYWSPTAADVESLESVLGPRLASATDRGGRPLGIAPADYRRQYIGFLRDGRKHLYANLLCSSAAQQMDWKSQPILVDDGGACFVQVEYDAEQGEIVAFSVNGEA